jgi:hypothetical protein
MIRILAEHTWAASRRESRIARTVVLKLKTSEFKILTRSHTRHSPPSSCEELTSIALSLRDRVGLNPRQRFRLVGVGLNNFCDIVTGSYCRSAPRPTIRRRGVCWRSVRSCFIAVQTARVKIVVGEISEFEKVSLTRTTLGADRVSASVTSRPRRMGMPIKWLSTSFNDRDGPGTSKSPRPARYFP